jgi:rhodanese-related sulfurtransferase
LVTGLVDYEEFCGIPQAMAAEAAERDALVEMTAAELKERLDTGESLTIIDVREPHEWEIANLEPYGARLMPVGQFAERMHELNSADQIVVHCRSGTRSAKAFRQLQAAGFRRIWNLKGGILAWTDEVDPTLPRY